MPTYSYKCAKCTAEFSLLRRRQDRGASAACPKCGAETKRRLIAAPGLVRSQSSKGRAGRRSGGSSVNGFTVIGGNNNVFIDCEGSFNSGAGFSFSVSGHHTLINTRSRGNQIGISISDDTRLEEYNTLIE